MTKILNCWTFPSGKTWRLSHRDVYIWSFFRENVLWQIKIEKGGIDHENVEIKWQSAKQFSLRGEVKGVSQRLTAGIFSSFPSSLLLMSSLLTSSLSLPLKLFLERSEIQNSEWNMKCSSGRKWSAQISIYFNKTYVVMNVASLLFHQWLPLFSFSLLFSPSLSRKKVNENRRS